jgi:uncharacterized protein (UPF0276 family)
VKSKAGQEAEIMQLAANYSVPTADLLRRGIIRLDRFKCPDWPDVIAAAQAIGPVYVHFPFLVGSGIGDAIDSETKQVADWNKVEALMAQAETLFVNVHLASRVEDHPDIPANTNDPAHIERLTGHLIRDVRAVVKHFGAERVIVENDFDGGGEHLPSAYLPECICRVVQETGCGLLLDVAHARIAAHDLGMDARRYIGALPLHRLREIHITGVQRLEGHWLEAIRQARVDADLVQRFAGRLVDHLPMTDEDWKLLAWVMSQIHGGAWGQPWIVTFEYGGVGPLFEAVTRPSALAEQIPRLYTLVKNGQGRLQ